MRALLGVLLLVFAASAASAGSADAPEVTDPAGDAGPSGVAVPAGFDDLDIVAAWFEGETDETIDLFIKTTGPAMGRPNSELGQLFDVKGTEYGAGYINFPGPLGFVGHYLCVANDVPASCIGLDGSITGDTVRTTIPKSNISSPVAGDAMAITGGASNLIVGLQFVAADTTVAGLPYAFVKGALATNISEAEENLTVTNTPTTAATPSETPQDVNNLPPVATALAVAAALGVALARRRA